MAVSGRPIFRLTHSSTGQKVDVVPQDPNRVTFYSCGPTVYDRIHVGNLRSALVADLLVRYMRHRGWNVVYVRNYTDIDDKIIQRAQTEGVGIDAITQRYIREVEMDYAAVGMVQPSHKTLATEHLAEMIAMVEALVSKGHAYVVGGDVLFAVKSFANYGAVSGRNPDDLLAGARVEVNAQKRDPLDFALWKASKSGEPSWPSPWGPGRPGWHLECSAMARKWLGDTIDIHHGGEDLVFPHHENETAQSECATGHGPFAKIWVHHAFLNFSQQKMSKSLGNVTSARDFIQATSGEIARYVLLAPHYRSRMEFSDEAIATATSSLNRLYEAKAKAESLVASHAAVPDRKAESAWGEFVQKSEATRTAIETAYANDLNIPEVLGALFGLIREWNRTLAEPRATATPAVVLGASALLQVIDQHIAPVLGIGAFRGQQGLEHLSQLAARGRPDAAWIEAKLQERAAAKSAKDFKTSDAIRDELKSKGVAIKDGPQGTTWSYVMGDRG